MKFSNWLNDLIRAKFINAAAFANAVDISRSRVSQMLAGDRPGAELCVRIAHALQLPTNDVLKRAGFPTVGDSAPGLTPHEAAMLRDYRRLSPEMRVRAAKIIKDLL